MVGNLVDCSHTPTEDGRCPGHPREDRRLPEAGAHPRPRRVPADEWPGTDESDGHARQHAAPGFDVHRGALSPGPEGPQPGLPGSDRPLTFRGNHYILVV